MKLFVAKKRRGAFGSVGCVCAQEMVLSAPGMRLLAASDTHFLTTMLRMNCIHVDVRGHVASTFAVQEAAEDCFCSVLLQSDRKSVFLTFLRIHTHLQEMTLNPVVWANRQRECANWGLCRRSHLKKIMASDGGELLNSATRAPSGWLGAASTESPVKVSL